MKVSGGDDRSLKVFASEVGPLLTLGCGVYALGLNISEIVGCGGWV